MTRRRLLAASSVAAAVVLLWVNRGRVREASLPDPPAVEARLAARIGHVQFVDVPFQSAVESLAHQAGIEIRVDWTALESAGIDPHGPIRLRLFNVTARTALECLLIQAPAQPVSPAPPVLRFDVAGNAIVLGDDASVAAACKVRRLYDLRDLVDSDLRQLYQVPPGESVEAAIAARAAEVAQLPPSTHPTWVCFFDPQFEGEELLTEAKDVVDTYAGLIGGTVAPDDWSSNGGSMGVLEIAGPFLLVEHRPAVHREIEAVLADLRNTSGYRPDSPGLTEHARHDRQESGAGLFGPSTGGYITERARRDRPASARDLFGR